MRHIADHLPEDGRYIGLAIMMYCGLRPGEVRALKWEDLHRIQGTFGMSYFEVHHTLDRQNNEVDHPKTSNGCRNIPVHCELSKLLVRWRDHVSRSLHIPMINGADGLPPVRERPCGYICCSGNNYNEPCRYELFADFAKALFSKLLDKDARDAIGLELAMVKNGRSQLYDPDDDLNLYVMRRNFWTWIQYGTSCTRLEKLYVMGHKMEENGQDVRRRYNTPQSLQNIAVKMNGFTILQELHPNSVFLTEFNRPDYLSELGLIKLEIPFLCLKQAQTVTMHFSTIEKNDHVELVMTSPLHDGQTIMASFSVSSMAPPFEKRQSLITQSSTVSAIERVKNASAADADSE